jgi:hypothetical protein
MPLSAPAAPIFSDVISWPSDTTAIQSLPSTIPSSPPAGATITDILVDSYWGDAENEGSYTFDGEDNSISADASFNLYPTDTIGEDSEAEAITLDFETSETIGTVNIIQQNVDEPAAVNIANEEADNLNSWDQYADTNRAGQTYFSLDHKFRIPSFSLRVTRWAGDITSHTYTGELWTAKKVGVTHSLIAMVREATTFAGVNAWNSTWLDFLFDPPAVLAADTKYAFVIHRNEPMDGNRIQSVISLTDEIEGQWAAFKTDLDHKATNAGWDANLKLSETDVSGAETIATFSDVTSGQRLPFTVTSMKNMYIQIIDPSNGAEGIKVIGMTADTYGFSTG